MKLAILAGGYGTRISEESDLRPKPMIEIGGRPILWHIMKYYSSFGINEFVILLGHKGYVIKEYFANYFLHSKDLTIDLKSNTFEFHQSENNKLEDWKVTLVETGNDTMTGGRVLRAKKYLTDHTFMLTYGDGLSNVNLDALKNTHNSNNAIVTLTSVQPEGRFGGLEIAGECVSTFQEKPKGDGQWVNGGFFVCSQQIFNYLNDGDATILEKSPLESLAKDKKLFAYKHNGFWKPMDTLRDKNQLQDLWSKGNAPWKIWD